MGQYGEVRNTKNWCSYCYRGHHDDCSGLRHKRVGGRAPSNKIPCECTECYPVIRVK